MSVTIYFNRLKKFWDESSALCSIPECIRGAHANCTCDLHGKILEMENTTRLLHILRGLNKDYDGMKSNILSMVPLPSVSRVYYLVY